MPVDRRSRNFLSDTELSPDQVVLCLPRQTASVSRLTVPEAARDSLTTVIGYEVERLFPFPKEEIYYDYLTYPVGGEEGRLGVVLFCLPRREVEDLLVLLSEVQLRPQMVTISSCGPDECPAVVRADGRQLVCGHRTGRR